MADPVPYQPAFSQPERRSFVVPVLLALTVVCAAFAWLYLSTPHRIADLSVTHIAVVPTNTVFKTDSIAVHSDIAEDDLYVFVTIRITDTLKIPLFLKDIRATLTAPDDTVENTSAVQKNDLPGLYTSFPKLKPLAGTPLLRETEIKAGESAEGVVVLHFAETEAQWKARKSASVTLDFYHQGPLSVDLPAELK